MFVQKVAMGIPKIFLTFLVVTSVQALTCETYFHFENLMERHKEDTRPCGDQNFHLHYLCALLNAQNFRKYNSSNLLF